MVKPASSLVRTFSDRPYQRTADKRIREKLGQAQSVLAIEAARTGKSILMAKAARAWAGKVYVVAPSTEILEQSIDSLEMFAQSIPAKQRFDLLSRVSFVTIQSFMNWEVEKGVNLILDEPHRYPAIKWAETVLEWKEAGNPMLGLGALASRMDGRSLKALFDVITVGKSHLWHEEQGNIASFRYFAPDRNAGKIFEVTDVKRNKKTGDYNQKELKKKLAKDRFRYGDIIKEYRKWADGLKAVVYAVDIEDAEKIVRKMRGGGLKTDLYTYESTKEERKAALDRYRSGETKVLVSVNIISEGFDAGEDPVRCVILARPTLSRNLWAQQAWRCLTTDGTKKKRIIIDHSGNIFNFYVFPNHEFDHEKEFETGGQDFPPVKMTQDSNGTVRAWQRGDLNVIEKPLVELKQTILERFRDKIVQFYNEGKTYQEIAEDCGTSYSNISRLLKYLREAGTVHRRASAPINAKELDVIKKRALAGYSIRSIAAGIGRSVSLVRDAWKRLGIYKRSRKRFSMEEEDLVRRLSLAGSSPDEIADELNNKSEVKRTSMSVRGFCYTRNIRLHKKRRKERIVQLYNEGKTYQEIAEDCGTSYSSVKKLLKCLGEAGTLPINAKVGRKTR